MDFDKYHEYLEERWDGMVELIEAKKLKDYALGRAMIKFSKSKNPISKAMQKQGMKQAKKYQAKKDAKLKDGLELIAEAIAELIIINVEEHGGKVNNGEVTPNKNGTAVSIIANYTECDEDKLKEAIENYIKRCIERRQVLSYDISVSKNRISVRIKLFK